MAPGWNGQDSGAANLLEGSSALLAGAALDTQAAACLADLQALAPGKTRIAHKMPGPSCVRFDEAGSRARTASRSQACHAIDAHP